MATAGSLTEAAFTEVLLLSGDTDLFSQQMDQVAAIYAAALEKMPDLDQISGLGFGESLDKLAQSLQAFASEGSEALNSFSSATAETIGSLGEQMSQAAEAITTSVGQINSALAEATAAEQRAAAASKRSASGLGSFFEDLTSMPERWRRRLFCTAASTKGCL